MPLKFTNARRAAALASLEHGYTSGQAGRIFNMHPGYVRQLKSLQRAGKLPKREPKRRLIKAAGCY